MLAWNRHWWRTHTHKSTPAVHKNSAHQNILRFCELEYLNKETAMNYTRQMSTLNWTHWGSSREVPALTVLWSDWILRFPRRAGSPEPRWGGATNQAKVTRDSRLLPYSSHTAATLTAVTEDSRHTMRKIAARLQRLLPYCFRSSNTQLFPHPYSFSLSFLSRDTLEDDC